ncbi:hypothetical protein MAR_011489 [Mya arenaria]|uniref:CUB domain-containing protein n=1 Tax=Mya arenaria TaxID=6604 RepID=A0ABY7FUZ4_MYAAR|nr:hypothetical protein MAR_011489 [Mya arenaria]
MAFAEVSMFWTTLVLFGLISNVRGQIQQVGTSRQTRFFLTSSQDCNGNIPREIGKSTVEVYGISTEVQSAPVTSCRISLRAQDQREPHRLKLHIMAAQMNEDLTNLYIYDGQAGGGRLASFSKFNPKPQNMDFLFTTGEMVTFVFSREYGYNYRLLGTKEIAGIVAGGFALVVLVVIIIVVCCYRKQRGINHKWQEEKIGHVNTAASLHTLNGRTASTSKPWTTTESARNGFASIRRSPNLPRAKIARSRNAFEGSNSSVTDSNASLPSKRPLPPPHVNSHRGMSERSYNPRSERTYNPRSERSYGRSKHSEKFDDSYSDRSLTTTDRNYSEKNYKPPTYREALRYDSESSADEHTFVQADETVENQQKVFVERVITPRVKRKEEPAKVHNKVIQASPKLGRAPPPPEEDEEYDSIEPKKFQKKALIDKGVDPESEEETEESDTENESESDEESEEESEESEEEQVAKAKSDKPDYVYSKPDKSQGKSGKDHKESNNKPEPQVGFRPPNQGPPPPNQFPGGPTYPTGMVPPGLRQPQPQYPGYPPPLMGQPQPYPQGYPQGQGQPYFPPHQQPQGYIPPSKPPQQPNSYNQANFTVPLQPSQNQQRPQYPISQPPSQQGYNKANDRHKSTNAAGQIPVYSYLVNRGYQPMEGRHSPMSNSTGASNLSGDRNITSEDSDYAANLGSGVELLRRK